VACFSFEDLRASVMGAADCLVIGQRCNVVCVDSTPSLSTHELSWLRRFIAFVDAMCELHVTVVLLLLQTKTNNENDNVIDDVFKSKDNEDKQSCQQDGVFAFDRTRSPLQEMSSPKCLASQWAGGGGGGGAKQQQRQPGGGVPLPLPSHQITLCVQTSNKLTFHSNPD
jgi:predicted ATPase